MAEPIAEPTTVEKRLDRLEKRFDELCAQVLGLKPRTKDWRQTVGMMPDDEISRTAATLGREWREQADAD